MDYVLKSSLHTVIGETVLADIRSQRSAYYFFIGGSDVLGETYSQDADDSYTFELAIRNEMISLKKIMASDVSFVIPRRDWVPGVVYDYYADYTNSFLSNSGANTIRNATFYVMTDEFKVYKCLFNNVGVPSVNKPTSTLSTPFVTADGYRWKYLFSVPLSSRTRFLNTAYIPVQTALSATFYSSGQIHETVLTNMGTGYTTAAITVSGDGTGAILTPVVSGGQIVSVTITNPGSGYTYANLTVTGNGTGATVTALLSVGDLDTAQSDVELLAVPGSIEAYRVTNQGTGYSSATVTITGGGTGATAVAVISNGKIVAIKTVTAGSGYKNPVVTITGTGTGASAVTVNSPAGGHGKNAINELYAERLSFFSNLLNDKNQGIAIVNNFRNIGIVRNVQEYATERLFSGLNASGCVVINFTGTAPLNDALLTELSSGSRFRVVQVSGSTLLAQNIDNFALLGNSVLLNTAGGSISAVTVTNPTINKFSGDVLMIDNFGFNQSSGAQIITFKTTIKF